jgi:hypothetical protein
MKKFKSTYFPNEHGDLQILIQLIFLKDIIKIYTRILNIIMYNENAYDVIVKVKENKRKLTKSVVLFYSENLPIIGQKV